MNKQCTNSSCRKTFSTLNHGGRCPFCGKLYPQIPSPRKDAVRKANPTIRLTLLKPVKSGYTKSFIRIPLQGILPLIKEDQRVDAVKLLHCRVMDRGYLMYLRSALEFCLAIRDNRKPCTKWILTGKKKDGMEWIRPLLPADSPDACSMTSVH